MNNAEPAARRTKEWGIRWRELDRHDRIAVKQRFFTRQKEFEGFCRRLFAKPNFLMVEALTHDPKGDDE